MATAVLAAGRSAARRLALARYISTSKRNSDTAAAAVGAEAGAAGEQAAAGPERANKNWVSYGFDYTSEEKDTSAHNASFFFSVTLCLVFGSFAWAYAPDVHMRDWAQREAFLELRRRERAGLKPIDPNYVDPRTVVLPDDDDIKDVQIII